MDVGVDFIGHREHELVRINVNSPNNLSKTHRIGGRSLGRERGYAVTTNQHVDNLLDVLHDAFRRARIAGSGRGVKLTH